MVKILDCTLRDGGYYTLWDFNQELIDVYVSEMDKLPIDYLEIGYRNHPHEEYYGEFFYCPQYKLAEIRSKTTKKLALMLNEKSVSPKDIPQLLGPCAGLVDMIRIAVNPERISEAISLAIEIKKLNFEVGFNVMYMSNWTDNLDFLDAIEGIEDKVDFLYMVDSFGGIYPEDVEKTVELLRSKTQVKLGFHGHNNLELGLVNTLKAIDLGVDIIDSTVTGMGRGAGNLKTELILTCLNSKTGLEFDFNSLSNVVDHFTSLQKDFEWGTNLAYMVSGSNSLPQKEVMEWVSNRYYSLNSIIRALSNRTKGIQDNQRFPTLDTANLNSSEEVLIVGGGPSLLANSKAIREYLSTHPEIPIIFASSKNATVLAGFSNPIYYCLVGNEGHRLEQVFGAEKIDGCCVLPPFPRKMGTYVPNIMQDETFELNSHSFDGFDKHSHTSIALQLAKEFNARTIYTIGYDGYSGSSMSQKEQELFLENEFLFSSMAIKCFSLTPTKYKSLQMRSIYSLV